MEMVGWRRSELANRTRVWASLERLQANTLHGLATPGRRDAFSGNLTRKHLRRSSWDSMDGGEANHGHGCARHKDGHSVPASWQSIICLLFCFHGQPRPKYWRFRCEGFLETWRQATTTLSNTWRVNKTSHEYETSRPAGCRTIGSTRGGKKNSYTIDFVMKRFGHLVNLFQCLIISTRTSLAF